jgi:hypothetical protein
MERARIRVVPSSDIALRNAIDGCWTRCESATELAAALRPQFPHVAVSERDVFGQVATNPPLIYVRRRPRPGW